MNDASPPLARSGSNATAEPVFVSDAPAPSVLLAPPLREDGVAFDQPLPPVRHGGAQIGRRWWLTWVLFLLIGIAGILVTAVVLTLVLGPDRVQSDNTTYMIVGSSSQLVGAVVAYVLLIFVIEGRRHPVEFRARGFLPGVGAGLLTGSVLMWVCVGLVAACGAWAIVGIDNTYSPWADLLMMGLGAGISEEIIFRGVMFRNLERVLGTWPAAAGSAAVFGLIHLGNAEATLIGALNIIVAGVMLTLMYVATRSLWFVMAVHAAWNLTQGPIIGSAVSGAVDARGFLVSEPLGSVLLNGGEFGLEGSVITVVVLAIVCVLLGWLIARRGWAVRPLWTRRKTNPIVQAASAGHPVIATKHGQAVA